MKDVDHPTTPTPDNAAQKMPPPSILAPAGNRAAFLAAIAGGADAVYAGLKAFSARMEAKNFTVKQLAVLTQLAHEEGRKVYVALNTVLKPDELHEAQKLLIALESQVHADGIIVQDLAFLELSRRAGFSGEIHLSTLANVGFGAALKLMKTALKIDRVVLPRELSVDEIKTLAGSCPKGVSLEVFVHGALCYGVSGRCYWSSFLGGKSGLRGRCVQPCRRLYRRKGQKKRYFSCQDFSLDVLAKILLAIPQIRAWKIEGRKKGPHYVYHSVRAYRLLRDESTDPQAKREAVNLLGLALSRPTTHYNILPQRPQNPVKADTHTGSGLLVAKTKGGKRRPFLKPQLDLLEGDLLRFGYEDEPTHTIYRMPKHVPARGRFDLDFPRGKSPPQGTAVFLVDRRDADLRFLLDGLEKRLKALSAPKMTPAVARIGVPGGASKAKKVSAKRPAKELHLFRGTDALRRHDEIDVGLWISTKDETDLGKISVSKTWWWLPPVIWPDDEKDLKPLLGRLLRSGARHFVLNAPWQVALFPRTGGLNIWAGPFCNLTNPMAINQLVSLGYSGAIVSPELSKSDYLDLPRYSRLPLGIFLQGHWPLCVSRVCGQDMTEETPFISPKGETAWVTAVNGNYWVFPNWKLDLTEKKDLLKKKGYQLFVHSVERVPKRIALKKRSGFWNWDLGLA